MIFIFLRLKNRLRKSDKTEKIILLADDEIMLRDLLAELLESYDYRLYAFRMEVKCLKFLQDIKADLLIIDFNMPEMDGLTCIRKLRNNNLKISYCVSTGSASAANDNEISGLQIDAVLTKPYEFEQMLEVVQKLIEESSFSFSQDQPSYNHLHIRKNSGSDCFEFLRTALYPALLFQ